jgi:hypothetical protein
MGYRKGIGKRGWRVIRLVKDWTEEVGVECKDVAIGGNEIWPAKSVARDNGPRVCVGAGIG